MVHKGDLLLVIDPRPYQAQLTQAEGQLAHDQAVLKKDQIDLDRYTGILLTLDNQIDTTMGTVKLKAIFPNEDDSLFPNQFVNARLLVETKQGATLVPTAAIQRNTQGAFVYLVKPDQTVTMRTVSVGTTDGKVSAVEGLELNDVIVVDGFDKLQDGVRVVACKKLS